MGRDEVKLEVHDETDEDAKVKWIIFGCEHTWCMYSSRREDCRGHSATERNLGQKWLMTSRLARPSDAILAG